LILEHEVANRDWKLLTLPLALGPAGFSVARISSLRRLDRVRGSAEVVLGNMSHTGGLTGGVGRKASGSSKRSRHSHGVPAQRPGLHHLHPTVGPRSGRFDRLARARVRCNFLLEQTKHVLRAGGSPEGQQLVMDVGERPASADRDQALITDTGQNHAISMPVRSTAAMSA
jgi:hypothetical protein